MSRPIDADRLKKQFPNMQKGFEHQIKEGYFSPQYVALMIDEAPTVEVQSVIMCADCKYLNMGENDVDAGCRCMLLRREVDPLFYCGYGMEKGDEKE